MVFENLETMRLLLREPQPEDAQVIYTTYASDPVVTRYLTWLPHISVEQTVAFITSRIAGNRSGNPLSWVIIDKEKEHLLGMIEARFETLHKVELGYVLGRSYWGNRYMSESVMRVVDFLFSHNEIYRIGCVCDIENTNSSRVLEKCGFRFEGILRRYVIHPNLSHSPRSVLSYSLVR